MVEAIARQLDRCDVCGTKIHKRDLVRTNMDFLAAAGSNYFPYSSYSSSGWTVDTSSDAGVISIGPFADRSRIVISDDNTRTESFGSQTWEDSGTFRTTASVDISSWDTFVIAFDAGPYERSTSPSVVIAVSACDANGAGKQAIGSSWTLTGSQRVWVTDDAAGIPSNSSTHFCFDVTVASGEKWWIDRIQIIKNATSLQNQAFVPTSGSSVDRIDTRLMTTRKVCPSCRERLLSRSERYGKIAEMRTEEPISVDLQEI